MTEHIAIAANNRTVLPQRRMCTTFDMTFGNQNTVYQISLGRYENGKIGEVFISGAKAGSDNEAIARDGAILLSFLLQYGIPLDAVAPALTRNADGSAGSIIGKVVDQLANIEALPW
jgi:ribonucleoside-diphosphate reductase alpha chain